MTRRAYNIDRERRIRAHLEALAAAVRSDPAAAQRLCGVLNREVKLDSKNFVKLDSELVERCLAQWDRLMEDPGFRAAAPRKSGAAAVRMLLETKLRELEAEGKRKKP